MCGPDPYAMCTKENTPLARKCADKVRALGGNIRAQEIPGHDKSGRHALFDVLLLTEGITWATGSPRRMEKGGSPFGPDLLMRTVQQRMSNARTVVAIGTASWEGDRKTNERRALDRAVEIATLVRTILPLKTEMWTLNLGQNTVALPQDQDSSVQRQVLIAGVIDQDDCVDLQEALRSALELTSLLKLSEYSLFEFRRFPPAMPEAARRDAREL